MITKNQDNQCMDEDKTERICECCKTVRKITCKRNGIVWELMRNNTEGKVTYTLVIKSENDEKRLKDFTDETMEAHAFFLLMADGKAAPEHLFDLWDEWKDMCPCRA